MNFATSPDEYRQLYVERGLGARAVAKLLGVSRCKVQKDLRRVGIEAHPRSEAVLAATPERLRELYVDCSLTTPEIASLIGSTERKIKLDLARVGIERRPPGNHWRPRVARERLEALVAAGTPLPELARTVGLPLPVVRSDLKNFGLHAVGGRGGKRSGITSSPPDIPGCRAAVHDAFDVIDTEAKAYAYGFVCADGSVSGNTLRIGIAEQDAALLVGLQRILGGAIACRPPARPGWQPQWLLTVCSRHVVAALASRGVVRAKDFVLPEIAAPEAHTRAFVRGLIDGDGSLQMVDGRIPRISFVNRSASLRGHVAGVWHEIAGEKPGERRWGNGYVAIYMRRDASVLIAKELYLTKTDAPSLERKRLMAWRFQERAMEAAA